MLSLNKGRYSARLARSPKDVDAAQRLRALSFTTQDQSGCDRDAFDVFFEHVLVFEQCSNALVCCYRFLPMADGREISRSYSAQYYDLSALESFAGKMVEMGRFCLRPGHSDPDVLRVAWGAMTSYVDAQAVELLFGCSAFAGTDAEPYLDAFAMLKDRHLAPKRWLPKEKAPDVFRFSTGLSSKPDVKEAMLHMPSLLRSYLLMGAWVSDHAVFDRQLNTIHVFTGLEIAAIPPARKKLLRAVAE
jgi:putative hemolysin